MVILSSEVQTKLYRLVVGKYSLVFLTDDIDQVFDSVIDKLDESGHRYGYTCADGSSRIEGTCIYSRVTKKQVTIVSVVKSRLNQHDQPSLNILTPQDKDYLAQYIFGILVEA